VGRAGDAATAQATLGRFRVVTLSGVGGVGKTRLALRVAANARSRYRDGAWICELAAVADAAAVPDLVATTLGVQQRLGHLPDPGSATASTPTSRSCSPRSRSPARPRPVTGLSINTIIKLLRPLHTTTSRRASGTKRN